MSEENAVYGANMPDPRYKTFDNNGMLNRQVKELKEKLNERNLRMWAIVQAMGGKSHHQSKLSLARDIIAFVKEENPDRILLTKIFHEEKERAIIKDRLEGFKNSELYAWAKENLNPEEL